MLYATFRERVTSKDPIWFKGVGPNKLALFYFKRYTMQKRYYGPK